MHRTGSGSFASSPFVEGSALPILLLPPDLPLPSREAMISRDGVLRRRPVEKRSGKTAAAL